MSKRWTHQEIASLKQWHNEGVEHAEIAIRLNRTLTSVRSYVAALRQGVTNDGIRRQRQTKRSAMRHGLSRHPLYCTFNSIYLRCYNKLSSSYPCYGGRGVTMEDYWNPDVVGMKLALVRFIDYAEKELGWYAGCGLSIDRIETDHDNYERGCLKLSTQKDQCKTRGIRNGKRYKCHLPLPTSTYLPFTWCAA